MLAASVAFAAGFNLHAAPPVGGVRQAISVKPVFAPIMDEDAAPAPSGEFATLRADIITKMAEGPMYVMPMREKFIAAFDAADTDKDGSIDRAAFGNLMGFTGDAMSDEALDKMFRECDADGDGRIDYPQWFSKLADDARDRAKGSRGGGGGGGGGGGFSFPSFGKKK